DELRRVETHHQDAVLHLHAEIAQRVPRAVGELEDVAIRQRGGGGRSAARGWGPGARGAHWKVTAVERDPVSTPLGHVAIDEVRRDIEHGRHLWQWVCRFFMHGTEKA